MRTLSGILSVWFATFAIMGQTVPRLLPFQGRLTDQNGAAVSNGMRLVQFKIFDVPSTGSPVWAGELHRTTVNGGLVNVLLGSKTPFAGVDFDRQLYLEITVDINNDNAITAADPPMLPRQVILPAVFAKEAADSRKLAGEDWTPIFGVNNPNVPIPATKLAEGSITSSQIAARSISPDRILSQSISTNELAKALIDLLVPAGSIMAFAGPTNKIPDGWLLCDGGEVSRTVNSRLFAVIGTTYGSGDGTTTFKVPNYRGRTLVGTDANQAEFDTLGKIGGEKTHTLTSDEMPSHNHSKQSWRGGYNGGGDWLWAWNAGNGNTGLQYTDNTGGGQPHNNLQPYITVNYIIKL